MLSAQIYDGLLPRVRGTVLLLHEHKTRPLPAGREKGRVEGQDQNPRFFQIAHKDFGKMFQVADSPVCGGDQLSLLEAPRSLCFCSPSAPFIKWEDDVACGAEGVLVGWREVEEVGG